jgi:hypothetical protein
VYSVQYLSRLTGTWKEAVGPLVPSRYKTEAERLAAIRSEKNVETTFRVREGGKTVSEWRGGKQLAKGGKE